MSGINRRILIVKRHLGSAVQFKTFNNKQQAQAKVDGEPRSHYLVWESLNASKQKQSQAFISIFSSHKYFQGCMKVSCLQVLIYRGYFLGKFPMWNRTWTSWVLLACFRFTHQKVKCRKTAIIKYKTVDKIYGAMLVVRSKDLKSNIPFSNSFVLQTVTLKKENWPKCPKFSKKVQHDDSLKRRIIRMWMLLWILLMTSHLIPHLENKMSPAMAHQETGLHRSRYFKPWWWLSPYPQWQLQQHGRKHAITWQEKKSRYSRHDGPSREQEAKLRRAGWLVMMAEKRHVLSHRFVVVIVLLLDIRPIFFVPCTEPNIQFKALKATDDARWVQTDYVCTTWQGEQISAFHCDELDFFPLVSSQASFPPLALSTQTIPKIHKWVNKELNWPFGESALNIY